MRQLSVFVYVVVGLAAVVVSGAVWRIMAVSGPPLAGDRPKHGLIGSPAPDFSLTLSDTGETVTLSSLRGQPVILDFFASWCPSCRAEAPRLQDFWLAYHRERVGPARRTGEIAALYRVGSIPTFVLVDREGRVANVVVGAMSEAAMTAEADALLR